MSLIKTLFFVVSGLSLHQIIYNIFPIFKQSYSKKIMDALIQEQNKAFIIPDKKQTIFDYPKLFSDNTFQNDIWTFNNKDFTVDSTFIYEPENKWDYTPRVVFQHYEWLFKKNNPIQEYLAYSKRYDNAVFYWHPSTATQRFFVLFYLFLIKQDNAIKKQLHKHIEYIIHNIEINLDGNHFLDNLLALLGYSVISNNDCLYKKIKSEIEYYFIKQWQFFPEKTPCYCALVYSRLQLIKNIPFPSKGFNEFCEKIEELLLRNPSVHLNDSYLPLSNWAHIYPKESKQVSNYYVTMTHNNYTYTIIGNSFAQKGYQAHSHDGSGALFVHNNKLEQIIGGFGTKWYAAGNKRNFCRNKRAYCKPLGLKGHSIRHFFGSFRNLGFDLNRYTLFIDHKMISMSVNNSTYIITINKNIISFNANSHFSIIFWSDFSLDCLLKKIEFCRFTLVKVKLAFRYDGIYNKKPSYKYMLTAEDSNPSLILK